MSQQGILVESVGDVESFATDSGTAVPAAGIITFAGGTDITTSGAGSTVTITYSGAGGLQWNDVTGATQALVEGNGYIANNAGGVAFSLPATAAIGDTFVITGLQASWSLSENAGQTLHFGAVSATTTTGTFTSTNARDSITLVCVATNTDFQVISSIGTLTIT